MRPWATQLRRPAACSMPSRAMSSTYWPRPRRKRKSSRRSIGLPMYALTVLMRDLFADRRPARRVSFARADATVGDPAAQARRVQHAVAGNVVDVLAAPAQEAQIFQALD